MYRLLTILIILWIPAICFADQIKIVDAKGLTRAVRQIEGLGAVSITLSTGEPVTLTLQHTSGAGLREKKITKDQVEVKLDRIKNGTWQLFLNPPTRKVKRIHIIQ